MWHTSSASSQPTVLAWGWWSTRATGDIDNDIGGVEQFGLVPPVLATHRRVTGRHHLP